MTIDLARIDPTLVVHRGDDWALVSPVPPSAEADAARFAARMRATLKHVVGPPEVRADVFGDRLRRADQICIAVLGGEVVGYLSYRADGVGAVALDRRRFVARFGPLAGIVRHRLASAIQWRGRADELYIEGFKVETEGQGRGIGGALLGWLAREVVRRGKRCWRTEAPVGADGAARTYAKAGARPTRTVKLGPLGRIGDRPAFQVYEWTPPSASTADPMRPQGR